MMGGRWLAAAGILALCSTSVAADVTLTQTLSLEGPAAAAMQTGQMPRIVTRIKGLKARTDVDVMGQTFSALMDAAAKQVIVLQSTTKTALLFQSGTVAPAPTAASAPSVSADVKPTGKSRTIDGMSCDEHHVALSFALVDPGAAVPMPAEAAAFLKDVRINASGSAWFAKSAPGVEDFISFQKAALDAKLMSALTALTPGPSGGMDKLWAAMQSVTGLPCLSEMTMAFEGAGPMVEMMKQQGPVKVIQKTEAVTTDPLADDIFTVPADYKVEKK